MSNQQEMFLHLQHCSAEINTAIREGFYVHMLPPVVAPIQDDDTGEVVDIAFCLSYEIVPANPERTKTVDYRDEVSRKRDPYFQPIGG